MWISVAVALGRSAPPDVLPAFLGLASLTLILILIGLELVLPFRRDWSLRGDTEAWRDIAHYFVCTQVGGATAQLIFVVGAASLMAQLGFAGGLGVWPRESPLLLQILLVIVLGDLLEYWTHRLSHSLPAVWPLHAIHHSPTRLSTVKATASPSIFLGARAHRMATVDGPRPLRHPLAVVALGTTRVLDATSTPHSGDRARRRAPGYHRSQHRRPRATRSRSADALGMLFGITSRGDDGTPCRAG